VMAAAWYGAVLPLMKKIPPLNDLLILPKLEPVKQTADDMAAAMRAWVSTTKH
jgi:hypothetical protein